ncbi:MAG TPA: hypothetical protein VMV29_19115 [Ktedonobacterales bacterium]|nr:hypothetical protein [Ktedonobacterales bacterium]
MPFYSPQRLDSLSSPDLQRFRATHLSLGYHPKTKDEFWVDEADRYAGTYIVGTQGHGKSGLIESMVSADADKRHAVVVIDPHGDLVDHCLAELTAFHLPNAHLLTLEDEAYPFGVNLFATRGPFPSDLARTQAIARIMHIFEVNWPEVRTQQYLPTYLRMATIVLLEVPGATLLDLPRFLSDEDFRANTLSRMRTRYQDVIAFWKTDWDDLSDSERTRRIQPLRNRLHKLFSGKPLMQNILGQRRTTIDFRRAIEERHLLFIKLPTKLAEEEAYLLGTILVAQLHATIFSFADLPPEQRPGVSLYIDEFQHFATDDIAELFTEGRKYGMRLTVAHQYRSQLPASLQAAPLTARTKICFHLTADDARELVAEFPDSGGQVDRNQIETHPIKYLLEHGGWPPQVQVFIDTYLRPLAGYRHGGKIRVENTGLNAVDLFSDVLGGRIYQERSGELPDPTDFMEHLLRETMRTGDPLLLIPPQAVAGYGACGCGFYSQALGLRPNSFDLGTQARFPMWLVIPGHDGEPEWTRRPENGDEQLWHFIFHLRRTMLYLAAHPIGKVTASNHAAVAQMLTQLPPRAAFVRSNQDTGTIFTHRVPARRTGEALEAGNAQVREQTRATYCRPRAEVERELYDTSQVVQTVQTISPASDVSATTATTSAETTLPTSDGAPRPRWEDVP